MWALTMLVSAVRTCRSYCSTDWHRSAEAMRNMALGDEAPAYLDKHPQREQPGAGALLKVSAAPA
jgi:hypothetical protein